MSLGVLETEYRRTLDVPGFPGSTERTSELLPAASFTLDVGKHVTTYASYTRGLEDSVNAPTSAVNRGEPVPATPTWQVDGGLRIVPRDDLQLLLGVFKVHKTYFNVDAAGQYEQLGDISSRGVEGSATLSAPDGLKVVAGLVLLRPEVDLQTRRVGRGRHGAGGTRTADRQCQHRLRAGPLGSLGRLPAVDLTVVARRDQR